MSKSTSGNQQRVEVHEVRGRQRDMRRRSNWGYLVKDPGYKPARVDPCLFYPGGSGRFVNVRW